MTAEVTPEGYTRHPNGGGLVADTANVAPGAYVGGNAQIDGNARIDGTAQIYGDARIGGNAQIYGNAWIGGNAQIYGDARIGGTAQIYGNAWIGGNAQIYGDARSDGDAVVGGDAQIGGNAWIDGYAEVLTSRHHMTYGPVGSEDRTVTLHRTVGGGHRIVAGCWEGTCDELATRIAKAKQAWPDVDKADRKRWRADYEAMLGAFRARANEWEVES